MHSPAPARAAARDTQRVLDGFRHVVALMRAFSTEAQAKAGLTAAQLFALQRLAGGGPLSVNALAEQTLTHQSTVSVVASRLEAKRLVRRRPAPSDKRRVLLEATAAGRKLAARQPASAQEALIAAVDSLPTRERQKLAVLLERVVGALVPAGAAAPPMFFEPPAARGLRAGGRGPRG